MYRRSQRWMLIINNRFLSLYDYNFLLVIEKIFLVNHEKIWPLNPCSRLAVSLEGYILRKCNRHSLWDSGFTKTCSCSFSTLSLGISPTRNGKRELGWWSNIPWVTFIFTAVTFQKRCWPSPEAADHWVEDRISFLEHCRWYKSWGLTWIHFLGGPLTDIGILMKKKWQLFSFNLKIQTLFLFYF